MNVYTVVMDYRGGTYISQASRRNIDHLLSALSDMIAWQSLGVDLPETVRRGFWEDVAGRLPMPIDGVRNVWCVSAMLGESMAIFHIVKTARDG